MMTSTYKIEPSYIAPLHNGTYTASAFNKKPIKQFFSAVATATTFALVVNSQAFSDDPKKIFPTAHTISPAPINARFSVSVEEPFQYENRQEVEKYISNKSDVLNLYKSLPVLIESVFGKAKVYVSVFNCDEENWSNLRVDIKSDHEIEELSALEDQLFKLLEKDKSFLAALEHVTICCG